MVDKEDVLKIAGLARISINQSEALDLAEHLSKSLGHFEKIANVDTTGVEPMVTPTEIEVYLREDEVDCSFTSSEMTQNAPDKMGHLFKVPPVVG